MLIVILYAIVIALGVYFGVLYNKRIIKDYQESDRRLNYFITVVVFVTITVIFFSVILARFKIDSSLKNYSKQLNQYAINNYSDNDFVKNGFDMTKINENVSELNKSVSELDSVLHIYAKELGIPNFLYNWANNFIKKELQKKAVIVNTVGKSLNSFVNKENFITVSSLLNGLRTAVMKTVDTIVFVIVFILLIVLGIYVFASLSIAAKAKKKGDAQKREAQEDIRFV